MREHVRKVNELVYSSRFLPHWGFHDDHRAVDRTAEYAPALQQVKAEFDALIDVIVDAGLVGGKCLRRRLRGQPVDGEREVLRKRGFSRQVRRRRRGAVDQEDADHARRLPGRLAPEDAVAPDQACPHDAG